jgi:rare lipoprotein A
MGVVTPRRLLLTVLAIGAMGLHGSCAGMSAAAETGLASWYAGGMTACGDRVLTAMSAAHKTLPCGAIVRVTTISREDGRKRPYAAGRSVVVTIRDRGPFPRGRIIDVSRDAAAALDLVGPGVRRVTVERLR